MNQSQNFTKYASKMLAELIWLEIELMKRQIHSFTKRENITELDSQQSFSWGEVEKRIAWVLLGTKWKRYLFPF